MKKHIFYILCVGSLLLTACKPEARIPDNASVTQEVIKIYPDYRDITVPGNIAPLNIIAQGKGEEYVAQIKGAKGQELLAAAGEDGKLFFDSLEWRSLLNENKGKDLAVTIYEKRGKQWLQHPAYPISVAEEEIDPYLSYRLIEPSYELYRQLGLYQRNLTNFNEAVIYENNDTYENGENHCINCHNYQNYDTDRMLFHVRGDHGGTVFVNNGKADKRIMTNDSILGNAVYPSWHPTEPWLVFSSNLTGQAFHLMDKQKIEVVDYGSDLIFYDAESNTINNVLKTNSDMENFPCWTPDGKKVFYCSAHVEEFDTMAADKKDERSDVILRNYDRVRYNLMSISFDESTRTWGTPQLEYDCASDSLSVSVPRVSPDGRYVLFTLGKFGQFHIWHSSSDLYVKDLQTGEIRPLTAANSDNVDSYHTWSSNGRWIVFSSRRDDGSYTRPYIAYFDKQGMAHKAFLLPQEDPEHNLMRMKSYNVPELTCNPIKTTPENLKEVIYADEKAATVTFRKRTATINSKQ